MSPEDVLFKLGQLESPEIARLMKDFGVKALRAHFHACAVTQYVYDETKARHINTGCDTLVYYSDLADRVVVALPDTVKQFVGDFDQGLYPELEAEHPMNLE